MGFRDEGNCGEAVELDERKRMICTLIFRSSYIGARLR
jgi:hypothetical protein